MTIAVGFEAIVADRSAPQKHVWRSNIILATADGGFDLLDRRMIPVVPSKKVAPALASFFIEPADDTTLVAEIVDSCHLTLPLAPPPRMSARSSTPEVYTKGGWQTATARHRCHRGHNCLRPQGCGDRQAFSSFTTSRLTCMRSSFTADAFPRTVNRH